MRLIVSINVGKPAQVPYDNDRKFRSSIQRKPVTGKIFLDFLGFEGDRVADPGHHGGRDKAVCVYSVDHYPFWEKELSRPLLPGAFGENLTVQNLKEAEIHIGDVFRIGEAEVQCSQPRQPCHKLNKVFQYQKMACRVQTLGYSGFYLRVLKPGWLKSGDPFELLDSEPHQISVDDANRLMHVDKKNSDQLKRILSLDSLSDDWRETFEKRLDRALQKMESHSINPP